MSTLATSTETGLKPFLKLIQHHPDTGCIQIEPPVSNPYNRQHKLITVKPHRTKELQQLFRLAHQAHCPVGYHARDFAHTDGLMIDLSAIKAIRHSWPADLTCEIELGQTLGELNAKLKAYGHWWPHSAHPETPLHQVLAKNLPSTQTGLAHTAMPDTILGLEAVTSDGRVLHTGGRVRKNVSGYDMRPLWIGTHHQLGCPTAAYISLSPYPKQSRSVLIGFESLEEGIAWVNQCHWDKDLLAGVALLSQQSTQSLQKLVPNTSQYLKPYRKSPWIGWVNAQGSPESIAHWFKAYCPSEKTSEPVDHTDTGYGAIAHYLTGHQGTPAFKPPFMRLEYVAPKSEAPLAVKLIENLIATLVLPYGLDVGLTYQPAQGRCSVSIHSLSDHQLDDPRVQEFINQLYTHPQLNTPYLQVSHGHPTHAKAIAEINLPTSPAILALHQQLKQHFDPHQLIQSLQLPLTQPV